MDRDGGDGGDDGDRSYYIFSFLQSTNIGTLYRTVTFDTMSDVQNVLGDLLVKIGKEHNKPVIPMFLQKVTEGQAKAFYEWDRSLCSTTTGVKKG